MNTLRCTKYYIIHHWYMVSCNFWIFCEIIQLWVKNTLINTGIVWINQQLIVSLLWFMGSYWLICHCLVVSLSVFFFGPTYPLTSCLFFFLCLLSTDIPYHKLPFTLPNIKKKWSLLSFFTLISWRKFEIVPNFLLKVLVSSSGSVVFHLFFWQLL